MHNICAVWFARNKLQNSADVCPITSLINFIPITQYPHLKVDSHRTDQLGLDKAIARSSNRINIGNDKFCYKLQINMITQRIDWNSFFASICLLHKN